MAQIDDLTTKVAAQDNVIQSAIALINGFKDRLAAIGSGDAQKVQALMQDLDNNTTALAQAVAANTPAAPATTAAPANTGANPPPSSGGGTAG